MLSAVSAPSNNQWWHPHCHEPVSDRETVSSFKGCFLRPLLVPNIMNLVLQKTDFAVHVQNIYWGMISVVTFGRDVNCHNWVGVAEPRCRYRHGLNWSLREHWSWEDPWESFWLKSRDQVTVPVPQSVNAYRTSERSFSFSMDYSWKGIHPWATSSS